MSKELPLDIVLDNDPQQIVFAGANAAPITLTLTNNDTRNAISVLVNAVRGDLLKKNDLILTPEELTGGGYKVVDETWVECRFGDPDAWQPIDEWATPFDLGALAAGDSVSFELRVNVPTASADVGRMCFAIMISATAGEDLRVLSVTIDQAGWALTTGDTTTATATVSADVGADDSVNWSSSNSGAATITNAGLITAVAPGTSVIEAVSVVNSVARSSRFVVVSDPVGPPVAGYVAWYDASDAASITESGGAVGEWRDRSGNDYHAAQTDAGLKPTTNAATQNGLNVISFNSDYMTAGDPLPTGKIDYTVFAVAKILTGLSSIIHVGTNDAFAAGTSFGLAANSSDPINAQFGHFYVNLGEGSDFTFNAFSLITAQQDGDLRTTRINETLKTSGTASGLNLTNSTLRIGGRWFNPSGFALKGEFAELIIYQTALTPAEVAAVESYLKAKWGL